MARRRVELVAAVCLCALVLRLSWAPLVPLASSWLSDTLYRPIVQLLTVVVTSLALGTMIKVRVPDRQGLEFSQVHLWLSDAGISYLHLVHWKHRYTIRPLTLPGH